MKFSKAWLEEWVSPVPENEEFFHQLTMAGLEVDGYEEVGDDLSGVVIAEIQSIGSVPDSKHLNECKVSYGEETVTVVCGAPNARAGLKTALALVGTELKGGVKIEKTKIRGIDSEGMLCSQKELGLGDDDEGILELPDSSNLGEAVTDSLFVRDTIVDLDLTPNRGDCLSIQGIAREVAVLNQLEFTKVDIPSVEVQISDTLPVKLDSPGDCPLYVGRVIKGIKPDAEAPLWIKEKLRRSGLRSIDAVVDITNYVMLELGQPMHAFDLGALSEEIVVRKASSGESLLLLDGSLIELDDRALVIADSVKPVALAGVMGGLDSAVSSTTIDVFLEAAFFSPLSLAGTARRFGLQTDACHRFERGVDPSLPVEAIERATALLIDVVGGKPGPVLETQVAESLQQQQPVQLSLKRLNGLLGVEIDSEKVDEIINRLGFITQSPEHLESEDDVHWLVTTPSHRFDVSLEADLIEEIARVFGYENIPTRSPKTTQSLQKVIETQIRQFDLKKHIANLGFQEVISYSFVDPNKMSLLDPEREFLALANPMSSEQSVMRSNLLPGLIEAAQANKYRQQEAIRLFELGSVFRIRKEGLVQAEVLTGLIWGNAEPEAWTQGLRRVDFYDIKGCADYLLELIGDESVEYKKTSNPILHPGQGVDVYVDGAHAGYFGQLHPSISKELDVEESFVFEIETSLALRRQKRTFKELSKYPSVRRDISILVDQAVEVADIKKIAVETLGELLVDSVIFDVYQGDGMLDSQKSVGLGLTLQSQKATLNEQEINELASSVLRALQDKLGATQR